MAVARRFVLLNDEHMKEFSESFDNENTKKKTLYDLKVFKEFLDTCDEKCREMRSLVRYCVCHSNIKFISSRHRVISSIYFLLRARARYMTWHDIAT